MKIRLHWLCAALFCCLICAPLRARAATLQTSFNEKGLATLRYGNLTLTDTNAHPDDAFTLYDVEGAPLARTWDAPSQTLTWTYNWGRVACQYAQHNDQLDLDISVENTSMRAVGGFNLFPLALRFNGFPKDYDANTPHVRFNSDGPSVQSADFGGGIVSVINRDVNQTLAVGLTTTSETARNFRYNLYVGSAPLWYQPNNWPSFNRPVAPGASDKYLIALRFSPPGTDQNQIATDLYQQFAIAHPSELNWDDRRPIASLFLASADNHPAKNPRGWFNNDTNVDITTSAGRAQLREKLMDYADRSIAELKSVGAQGMITWDIEGQQYPHAISYIGDPRLLEQLTPEMEPLADEYFARFRAAGLRVGVCVRPQKLVVKGGDADQTPVPDIAAQLIARIQYAKTRWGATLFYVDSNGGPYDPTDAQIFREVARAHPDVLLIPEHQNSAYYATTAPYNQLGDDPDFTPTEVRQMYPRSFSVVKVRGERMEELRPAMIEAARNGDILMFNGWYDSDDGRIVREIYAHEAQSLTVTTVLDRVADDGQTSLREAMLYANALDGAATIRFAPGVRGTLKLNGTALPILVGECEIIGPGTRTVAVDGGGKSGLFRIARGAKVVLSGLTLRGGAADAETDFNGGAIWNQGDLTLRESYLKNNSGNAGGAIFNVGATVSIERSTLQNNAARDSGGAIWSANGALALWQCTLTGNKAQSGGAIGANAVDLSVKSCTLATNQGAGVWLAGGALRLHNSIVAANGACDLQIDGGALSSNGYNLVGAPDPRCDDLWQASDLIGANARLGALRFNGGKTPTCALAAESAALNAGDPALRDATDQRGYARKRGGCPDIGAYESRPTPPISSAPASGSGGSS